MQRLTWMLSSAALGLAPMATAQQPPATSGDGDQATAEAPARGSPAANGALPGTRADVLTVVTPISPSSKTRDGIVLPSGHLELGGELAVVTSEPRLSEDDLEFTDLALFKLDARRAFAPWLELGVATALLAKQPSTADEPIWQSASLGARAAFAEHFAASAEGQFGWMLDDAGHYWVVTPALLAKFPSLENNLRFELGLGNSLTLLQFDERTAEAFWLDELAIGGEVQIGRSASLWVAVDYRVPIAHNPSDPDARTGAFLDPQVRLNLQVGGVLSWERAGWDVFVAYRFVDRGELDRPATTLPILDGGFDQQQTVLGVQHRFGWRGD